MRDFFILGGIFLYLVVMAIYNIKSVVLSDIRTFSP